MACGMRRPKRSNPGAVAGIADLETDNPPVFDFEWADLVERIGWLHYSSYSTKIRASCFLSDLRAAW